MPRSRRSDGARVAHQGRSVDMPHMPAPGMLDAIGAEYLFTNVLERVARYSSAMTGRIAFAMRQCEDLAREKQRCQ